MAQVIVRNLDDQVVRRLKARAKRNRRSLEAELRAILTDISGGTVATVGEDAPAYDTMKQTHEERPPNSGIWWPRKKPSFKAARGFAQTGKPASEMLIEDRS